MAWHIRCRKLMRNHVTPSRALKFKLLFQDEMYLNIFIFIRPNEITCLTTWFFFSLCFPFPIPLHHARIQYYYRTSDVKYAMSNVKNKITLFRFKSKSKINTSFSIKNFNDINYKLLLVFLSIIYVLLNC